MISDAYTREYDEQQRVLELHRKHEKILNVAHRFGCEVIFKAWPDRINVNIMLPNGKLFHRFNTFEKALEWAERWGNVS